MKQVYKEVLMFNLGDGFFEVVECPLHYGEYQERQFFKSRTVTSWEEALEMVKIFNDKEIIRTKKSIFGKTLIQIWDNHWCEWTTISEKKFKSVSFKFEAIQENHCSLEYLIKHLSAKEFIDYLKDMGDLNSTSTWEDLLLKENLKKIIIRG